MSKCLVCGKKLSEVPNSENESCYTELGYGPLCDEHYEKLQAIDDRLKIE